MDRDSNDRMNIDGNPDAAGQDRLNMQPGRLDDIESAEAYATRAGQPDVTGDMPAGSGEGRRTLEGERLHDREDMSASDGMASTDDSPMERGERQSHTGGGANRDRMV